MFESRIIKPLLAGVLGLTPLLYLLTITPSLAQSSSPPSRPLRKEDPDAYYRAPSSTHGKTILIPIGTMWEGRIDTTISSTRSRPGTAFSITMSSPVLLNGTEVVVPAGSSIIGEVVEAVPASNVPKKLGQDKRTVRGKLRVQVSGLRTPDGVTHPLVASLVGEVDILRQGEGVPDRPMGTGVAYMGSSSSFEAVDVNRSKTRNTYGDRRPPVVKKSELLADPILGAGEEGYKKDRLSIRSLVLKNRDYWIYAGSPLTVRLQAPFKIGIAAPGMGAPVGAMTEIPDELPPPTRASAGGSGGFGTKGGAGLSGPTAGGYIPPAGGQAPNRDDSF